MNRDKVKHWDSRFGSVADEALTWFQSDPVDSLSLIEKYAPDPAQSFIDLGAGNSRLVERLLQRGQRDITLFDLSAVALSQTRNRLGTRAGAVNFVQGDVTDWSPARRWDIWHDRAVFHFMTTPAMQESYLDALRSGTTQGAAVILSVFSLKGPEKCSGLPVQRYSSETLANRLGPDFRLKHSETIDHDTPAGNVQSFTFAVFRRA